MGRRASKPGAVPHLRARKRGGKVWYYYDHGGKPRKEQPLGCDYGLAIMRWAEIQRGEAEKVAEVITFRYVANRYRAEVLPLKAPRTQRDNAAELERLLSFFDDPPGPLDAIEPQHVQQYLDWRATAPVRAAREKALLSHIWNFARRKGYTRLPNPCAGVRAQRSKGRDAYIEDADLQAMRDKATQPLRDAIDLAYLTGHNPGDILALTEHDIRDGVLHIQRSKTRARVRIEVVGELAELIERIKTRKQGFTVYNTRLIVNEWGRPVSLQMLQRRWQEARKAAKVSPTLHFRDLRAKAATDKADSAGDIRQAQQQLGHGSVVMTEHYVRQRRGAKVKPTK